MKKANILVKYFLPSLLSALAICLMLYFAPKINTPTAYNFDANNLSTHFINTRDSAKLEALKLYDFEPIFLPTSLNISATPPKEINIDSFKDINNTEAFSSNSYSHYILNKKELRQVDNIFQANIRELMPYYKVEDSKDLLPPKELISISVIDTKNGEEVANENLKLSDTSNKFFVPTEVFLSISDSLNINIVDNTSSSTLESSTTELLREALNKTKIFNSLNSGYYKVIISP